MIARALQLLFHLLFVRPLVFVAIGISVRGRERLPRHGPAVVVANHNSHLDTAVLMSLFPALRLSQLRPVAAAEYFLRSRWLSWFSLRIMGIIPVDRSARERGEDPLAGAGRRLDAGDILILYPEGTRGEPERMAAFKKGISHLIERHHEVSVVPVYMRGLGKALPKGSRLPVPFFCDVVVGEPLAWPGDRDSFMTGLRAAMESLAPPGCADGWE
jgi:1-acyl-sn-glycerol-3-phosphate acyltransferase